MSQSYLPDWKPGEFDAAVPSLAELESPRAAQPGQAATSEHVAGVPSIAALDADAIRRDAEQAALEAKHGKLGTAGMHYARGVLNAVLSSGSYAGAGLESLGSAAGWQGLEDFGRGLGESATGQAFMEAAAFMLGSATGGEQEGLSDYDRMRRDVQESQQAWPMLSMLSSAAGMATVGILTGGSSSATTLGGRAAAMGTVGAIEGGGAGAQAAYEQSAPLRDVLSSAVIGAALGGALGGGATAAGGALMRSGGKLSLEGLANQKALQASGALGGDLNKITQQFGPERLQRMGRRLRDEGIVGGTFDSLEDRAARLAAAQTKAGKEIESILGEADAIGAPDAKALLARLQGHADELKGGLGPEKALGARIESQFIEPFLEQVNKRGSLSFSDLHKFKVKLSESVKRVDFVEGKNLAPFRKEVKLALEDAVAELGGDVASKFKAANEAYGDLATIAKISQKRVGQAAGNRTISLTDTIAAGSGAIAGGPLGGLATGLLNRGVRQYGDAAAVNVIGALQKLGRGGVSVQRAGGREAKEVIDELAGLKGSVRKAIADAGDNPEVRFAAERAARAAAAEELGKKAGSYNVAKWDKSAPTPVQKVLFRRELLDRASQDLAADFKATSALRPPTDFDIDPGRLGKLLRDADGPEAIGALQQRVLAAAKEAPPTPLGDALRYRIGQSRAALSEADLPGSMVEGHKLLRDLEKAAQSAPDELTRSYVARTAAALSDDLGSQAFGSAGQLYRSLRPDQSAFEALGSADLLRNALRTTAERGKLPELVAQYGAQLEAAVTAAKKLGSPATVKGLQKQLRALEARFAAAEEAVTLDGGPIARVLDFFEGGLDGKVAASVAPGASLETMVGDTVRGKMETLLPALKAPQQGRYRPGATRAAAAVTSRLTVAEQHELYRERVQLLGQAQGTNGAEVAELAMEGMPPGTPAGLAAVIGADFSTKLATLAAEIPRPKPDIRGKAFETLSSDDVRRANAMFEATTDPLSVFDDFRAGSVDYDKVQYAWRQYPGLKQAAQLALVDAFQEHLSDEDKAAIPDGTITQLDYLLGFEGRLQPTLEPGFSARMDQIGAELAAQAAQQQAQRKALELPSAKPSYTERVGGASA